MAQTSAVSLSPWRLAVLVSLVSLTAAPLPAQGLPDEPITLGGGRLTISGEASVSIASDKDEQGWFNYTDYEQNVLRMIRLGVTAALRAGSRVSVLGEMRTENWDALRPYALYVRVRPWIGRPIDVQAGLIPPSFGAFARRNYAADNPLIGYPLAYQYLTSLRPDALPASADDLLRMRARGWRPSYPLGNQRPEPGRPLVTAFSWDTGVQVRVGSGPVEGVAAVTNGTLSHPQVRDNNGGKQISGRIALRPAVGLIVGASAARGAFLDRKVDDLVPPGATNGTYTQRAVGLDLEYSRGYWLLRSEAVLSAWRLPAIRPPLVDGPLRALAVVFEGRYKIRPGLYGAARFDHLDFNRIAGSRRIRTWDAPVTRVEAGGGYYVRRNLLAKAVYQHNWRDGGLTRSQGFAAAQLLFWF